MNRITSFTRSPEGRSLTSRFTGGNQSRGRGRGRRGRNSSGGLGAVTRMLGNSRRR